jgi:hydrogenase nickel incorporation protein HypA/HybF
LHELSIALEILDIVEKEAVKHGATVVRQVNLKVGDLSGVETESLAFSFDAVKGEKELTRNAVLAIERLPVKIHCTPCDDVFQGAGHLVLCPQCEGFETKLLQGEELEIEEIEID